jgi:heme-degrading monooxygenase HmoA
MPKGILIAAFDFSTAHADEFHDWYDLEHIPERQRVPGFGACERWIGAANPNYAIATYDLDTPDVLRSEAYRAIAYDNLSVWSKRVTAMCTRLIRFEGEQTLPGDRSAPKGAGGLLLNAMNVVPEHEADFNDWYNNEHIPALSAVPGVLCARRYRGDADAQRYVALYHLESADIANGAAWKKAASSPWTDRLRPHFRDHLRILTSAYRRAN